MLYLDIPSRDELRQLLEHRDPASVSIYLPTTPLSQDAQADRIALANLQREALRQLEAAEPPRGAVQALDEQLAELVQDDEFWRFQAHGLAIFATPERVQTFRLPTGLQPQAEVSDRFHLLPLLRAVTFPQAAYVLALAAGGARLLEIAPTGPIVELRVENMPADVASVVGQASVKGRSPSQRIQGSEGEKVRLRQYARAVDRAVRERLHGEDAPLILISSYTLGALYRSVNSYPHLIDASVRDAPGTLSDQDITRLAREQLDEIASRSAAEWRALFARREPEGRTVSDLAVAARAAVRGVVASAMVDMDAKLPGLMDERTGEILIEENPSAITYGVLDAFARQVLLQGGQLLAVRAADLPERMPVAAILRHPLIRD